MDACFVCLEEGGRTKRLYRVCRCRTRVHEHCFEALVLRVDSHSTACPVCRERYRTEDLQPCVVLCFLLYCAGLAWLGFVFAQLSLRAPNYFVLYLLTLLWSLTVLSTLRRSRRAVMRVLPASQQQPPP